jgi:hypothetical protein
MKIRVVPVSNDPDPEELYLALRIQAACITQAAFSSRSGSCRLELLFSISRKYGSQTRNRMQPKSFYHQT